MSAGFADSARNGRIAWTRRLPGPHAGLAPPLESPVPQAQSRRKSAGQGVSWPVIPNNEFAGRVPFNRVAAGGVSRRRRAHPAGLFGQAARLLPKSGPQGKGSCRSPQAVPRMVALWTLLRRPSTPCLPCPARGSKSLRIGLAASTRGRYSPPALAPTRSPWPSTSLAVSCGAVFDAGFWGPPQRWRSPCWWRAGWSRTPGGKGRTSNWGCRLADSARGWVCVARPAG